MLGNTFGRVFRITTCGESYGSGLAVIVDGVPAGMKLTNEMIQEELDKRKPGQSELDSPRKETDIAQIFAGLGQEGLTTGAPVGIIVYNVDRQAVHVEQYRKAKHLFRPGHAEYTYFVKYGEHYDWCGAGRGEPVFDQLSATIAHSLMSIGAVKGVEIGAGFRVAGMKGSECNDPPYIANGRVRFRTNNSGGFLGGITNGEDLVIRMAVKPTPTISLEQDSVDKTTMREARLAAITRRDATICPRIYPVAEAMVRIAILDALFMWRGWEGVQQHVSA